MRRTAAKGVAVFMAEEHYHLLVDSMTDDDPEVRRHAYSVMLPDLSGRSRDKIPWPPMSDEQLEAVVRDAKQQVELETNPELHFLARSVLGRKVNDLCRKAYQQRQQMEDYYSSEQANFKHVVSSCRPTRTELFGGTGGPSQA